MYPTLVSRRSALSTLLMPSASHSCVRLIPGRFCTNASTLCATVGMASNVYSLASPPANGTLRSAGRLPNCCSWSENQPVAYYGNSLGLPRLGVSGEPPLAPFPVGELGRVLTEHHPVETFSTCRSRIHASAPRILLATGSIPPPRRFFISGDRPTMAPCPPSLRLLSIPTTARSVPASARLRLPSPRGLSARKPLGQRRQPSRCGREVVEARSGAISGRATGRLAVKRRGLHHGGIATTAPASRDSWLRLDRSIEATIRSAFVGHRGAVIGTGRSTGRSRYRRSMSLEAAGGAAGYRHVTIGTASCSVIWSGDDQRATRTTEQHGRVGREWHSEALPRYVRMTKQVEAVIAGASVGHQHAPGSACTRCVVQGGGRQGCRQPNVAEVQTDW